MSSGIVLALEHVRQLLVVASLRLVVIEIPFGHPCHSAIADSTGGRPTLHDEFGILME